MDPVRAATTGKAPACEERIADSIAQNKNFTVIPFPVRARLPVYLAAGLHLSSLFSQIGQEAAPSGGRTSTAWAKKLSWAHRTVVMQNN